MYVISHLSHMENTSFIEYAILWDISADTRMTLALTF